MADDGILKDSSGRPLRQNQMYLGPAIDGRNSAFNRLCYLPEPPLQKFFIICFADGSTRQFPGEAVRYSVEMRPLEDEEVRRILIWQKEERDRMWAIWTEFFALRR